MRALIFILLSLLMATSALSQIIMTPDTSLKSDGDLRANDMIMGFQLAPGNYGIPEKIVTLYADGRIEYGPAWSPENFYRVVCANRHFGDCI